SIQQMDGLDQLEELQDGLLTMATEYELFHHGLVEYTDGISELANSYEQIDQGITKLADGTRELNNGVGELYDGTRKLQEETSNLPEEMESEIDKFMEDFDFSDFEAKSFIAPENKKIGVVQFVLQTDSIKLPDEDEEDI